VLRTRDTASGDILAILDEDEREHHIDGIPGSFCLERSNLIGKDLPKVVALKIACSSDLRS